VPSPSASGCYSGGVELLRDFGAAEVCGEILLDQTLEIGGEFVGDGFVKGGNCLPVPSKFSPTGLGGSESSFRQDRMIQEFSIVNQPVATLAEANY